MAAPKGNKFWELRSKHGRDLLFNTPELLWQAACEYFEWCEENPFQEAQLTSYQGQSTIEEVPKMRPFTMEGLCFYLNANTAYFRQFKGSEAMKREDFSTVVSAIEEVVQNQQFSGAAAGFLNANIISRKLGLKDSSEMNLSGEAITIKVVREGVSG